MARPRWSRTDEREDRRGGSDDIEALEEQRLRDLREIRLVGKQEGRLEGRLEGLASLRTTLRQVAERKFDAATVDELARRLDLLKNPVRLVAAVKEVTESETGGELLDRVG